MKKFMSLLLVLVLSLSLVACGNKDVDTGSKDQDEEQEVEDTLDIKETIKVQVEEDWLLHYEKVAERV